MTERSVPCVLCIAPCRATPLGLWECGVFVSVRRAQWGICPQPFAVSCWLACSHCHRNGVLKRGGGSFCLGAAERKHQRDQGGQRERKCKKKQTSIGEYTSVAPFWSSLHLFGKTVKGFVHQGRNRLHEHAVIEENKEASYTRATLILQLSEVGKSRLC